MRKNKMRLTESQLHRVIKESVKKMLKEVESSKYSKYDSRGFDRDGFDKNGYDEDGYDRDGWNSNGVHLNGYNREQFSNMQNNHEQAKDVLLEPSIQLQENILNFLNILRSLSKTNEYVDLNEENTYFSVLNNTLGEVADALTDTIDFLNDTRMGY